MCIYFIYQSTAWISLSLSLAISESFPRRWSPHNLRTTIILLRRPSWESKVQTQRALSRSENRDLPWGNQLKSIQNIEDTSTNGYNMTQLDSSAASSFQSATGQFPAWVWYILFGKNLRTSSGTHAETVYHVDLMWVGFALNGGNIWSH